LRLQLPASGIAPQTFGVPAPPQTKPPVHPPQSMGAPHPLSTMPQYLPDGAWSQVVNTHTPESGAAPQKFGIPLPPQVYPGVSQASLQWMVLRLQFSPISPQYCGAGKPGVEGGLQT
jgi:hypothetical protein